MSDLTAEDRTALTAWVFTFTEAQVISDPEFRTVERIVAAHVAAERERIESILRQVIGNTELDHIATVSAIDQLVAEIMAAIRSERGPR